MYRLHMSTTAAVAVVCFGLALPTSNSVAQQKPLKEQIVGSWAFVSADTVRPDGSKVPTFGPNPSGLLIFGSDGRYVSLVVRADVPKFASNSRTAGTPDENKAAVQGSIAHFGRYTINEAEHTLTMHIERSSYPNWSGAEQGRPFTLVGDELKYTVPTGSAAQGRGEVVLKRAK
jgi:hypothetical protein